MPVPDSIDLRPNDSINPTLRDTRFWKRIRQVKSVGDVSTTPSALLKSFKSIPNFKQGTSESFQNPRKDSSGKRSWTSNRRSETSINLKSVHSSSSPKQEETSWSSSGDCPSIPRFSWQSRLKNTNSTLHRPRHVEIIIPSSIATVSNHIELTEKPTLIPIRLPPLRTSSSTSEILSQFPFPKTRTTMGERTASDRPSSGHSRSSRPVDSGTATSLGLSTKSSRQQLPTSQSHSNEQQYTSFLTSPPSEHVTRPTTASSMEPLVAGIDTTTNNADATASNLTPLACDTHRTTGHEPPALVGASTTIVKDKLYVFGGRRLSRRMPQLTRSLYELDLIQHHWTKLRNGGSAPIPRYFHSMCALGDSKLVCYGGMAQLPETTASRGAAGGVQTNVEASMTVMSDVHIYDIATQTWTFIPTAEAPPGRYAHCAAILPSSAVFASAKAPLSAMHHNPGSGQQPNQGTIGITLDGRGGAEMVIVGGQDSGSRYIEQISVFNLRNLRWTVSTPFERSCGAYRSVAAPLLGLSMRQLGTQARRREQRAQRKEANWEDSSSDEGGGISGGNDNNGDDDRSSNPLDDEEFSSSSSSNSSPDGSSHHSSNLNSNSSTPMLLYSNYNFLSVKLELQIRLPNGTLVSKPMSPIPSPPGLRFPNGGVIAGHFVISGTFLTSTKQEYALWALDLRSLCWKRVDVGGGVFTTGSWNRGVLWEGRNKYVVLGNRKRNLGEDYNHRRLNFAHFVVVDFEAFGLYQDPIGVDAQSLRSRAERSGAYRTNSSMNNHQHRPRKSPAPPSPRTALGLKALLPPFPSDMSILSLTGERIPANSQLLARRWGSYFQQLIHESDNDQASTIRPDDGSETSTLKPSGVSVLSRSSQGTGSSGATLVSRTSSGGGSGGSGAKARGAASSNGNTTKTATTTAKGNRHSNLSSSSSPSSSQTPTLAIPPSRLLYLPHTPSTIHALLHYLYTTTLPLCTPQTLCSLLQLAKPYRVSGLLDAVVSRLHSMLDARTTPGIFHSAALACGSGDAVGLGLGGDDSSSGGGGGGYGYGYGYNYGGGGGGSGVVIGGDVVPGLTPATKTRVGMLQQNRLQSSRHGHYSHRLGSGTSADARLGAAATATRQALLPRYEPDSDDSGEMSSTSPNTSDVESEAGGGGGGGGGHGGSSANRRRRREPERVWRGGISGVVGLQRRGLRGLLEGRKVVGREGEGEVGSAVEG